MIKYLVIIGVIAMYLAGCSPFGGEETVKQDSSHEAVEQLALAPVDPTADIPATFTPTTEEAAPESASALTSETDDELAAGTDDNTVIIVEPSGSINLGELASPPITTDGENVEMPAPGIPNPKVKMVQLVKEDLANRRNKDVSAFTLISVEEVEWQDSSLGCPASGTAYLTVITPGYRITLEDGADSFDYNTDMRGNFVLCVDGAPASSGE